MKKIMLMAITALIATTVSAQGMKKECCKAKDKQLSKAECVERDIQRFQSQFALDEKQAESFAATFREYHNELDAIRDQKAPKEEREKGKELSDEERDERAKARFERMIKLSKVQEKYYSKFRKELSAAQVEEVMRLGHPHKGGKGGKDFCPEKGGKGGKKF